MRCAIALTLALAAAYSSGCSSGCAWGGPAKAPAQAQTAATPAVAPPASAPGAASAGAVSGPATYKASLKALKDSIDYPQFDVDARVAKLGTAPRAIAVFVQNEIRYQAYSGALRGARGTLMALAGNSLDRALLLSAMLRASGHKTRFAEGTLTTAQAEQLVRSGLQAPRPTPPFDPSLQPVVDRARKHFFYLGNALYASGFRAPEGNAGAWNDAVRDAQRHFWVQMESEGRWMDIDPSPGTTYGQALTTATAQADEPAGGLFHTVEIRVDVELIRNARRETRTVLSHTARAADLAGVPLGIFHERKPGSSTPVLVVGDQLFRGDAFTTTTTIGVDGLAKTAVVNPFDTVSDSGGDRVSGVWIKFHVTTPAGVRDGSYPLVDTEGAAARASGAAPKAVSEDNVTASLNGLDYFVGIALATGGVPAEFPPSIIADGVDPGNATGVIRLLSTLAFVDHHLRGLLPSSFLETPSTWYVDAPSVVIAATRPESSGSPGAFSLDLTLKSYRILRAPDDPRGQRGLFYDYLAAGALDHTLERWLMGPSAAARSVGALFEEAGRQQVDARVLTAPSAPLQLVALSEDARTRLGDTLANRRLIVVPGRIPDSWRSGAGWWAIDPSTGWTEDTTEDGHHGPVAEDQSWLYRLSQNKVFKVFCAIGVTTAAAAYAVHGALSVKMQIGSAAIQSVCAAVAISSPRPPAGGGPAPPPQPPAAPPDGPGLPPEPPPRSWDTPNYPPPT